MQHEVYVNRGQRTRATRPFVVVLQSDYAVGPLRLVCPLLRSAGLAAIRAMPLVTFADGSFLL